MSRMVARDSNIILRRAEWLANISLGMMLAALFWQCYGAWFAAGGDLVR
jgi:cytochrome c biogenesis protein CcdA